MNDGDGGKYQCENEEVSRIVEGTPASVEWNTGDFNNGSIGFPMIPGFSRSMNNNIGSVFPPFIERVQSSMLNYNGIVTEALAPVNKQLRDQIAPIVATIPTFTMPPIDLGTLNTPLVNLTSLEALKRTYEQQFKKIERLRDSLGALRGLHRNLLPPNLRDYADEIELSEIYEFVEQEGIPIYLVPRGRIALRLLRAKDRAGRRQVIGECYESLMDDCAAVLELINHQGVSKDVSFVLDGVGAMRAGHHRSAQALFTVVLDSLILRLHTDKNKRRAITNRKKGSNIPDVIDEMGLREAFVWLPIWNAHEQFWVKNGDKIPYYYSRHASVHGVSSRQFSKRNCIQVLMLVTSLLGYMDRRSVK